LPTTKGRPACLLDAGATMDADEHNILQFARMASRFMEKIHGVDRPSVGLINVGEEPEKGGRMQLAAHALLEGAEDLNFYGNIEGRDVTRGITDICVTDGFTGNVLAKGMEGVVDVFVEGIRRDIFGGPLGKVAGRRGGGRPRAARAGGRGWPGAWRGRGGGGVPARGSARPTAPPLRAPHPPGEGLARIGRTVQRPALKELHPDVPAPVPGFVG